MRLSTNQSLARINSWIEHTTHKKNIITGHSTTALMKRNLFHRKGKEFGVSYLCKCRWTENTHITLKTIDSSSLSRMKVIWIRVCYSMNNGQRQSQSNLNEINEPKIITNIVSFNSCHPSFTFSYFLFCFVLSWISFGASNWFIISFNRNNPYS